MSPVISLDEAAGAMVLRDSGKPLFVLDWPQRGRGHCAGLCWMSGLTTPERWLFNEQLHLAALSKAMDPTPQKMLAGAFVAWPHLKRFSCQVWALKTDYPSAVRKKDQMQLNQDPSHCNMCVSEVVKCFYISLENCEHIEWLTDNRFYIWHFPGYPWSYHKRAQLADSPTHCWASPVSHTGVKAQGFSTDSCYHSFIQSPQMGPPILPFGRVDFHSNGHLRKRHLGPAWGHLTMWQIVST